MAKKITITMIIPPDGKSPSIDVDGLKGASCLKETEALEKELGKVEKRTEKPEMKQTVTTGAKAKVGS